MFGFLNVYKPTGKTSHDVVAIVRRITKIKQIGHTGTLDPFAEGVLPICIGKATRLIEYLNDEKAYIGTIQFGSSTTTYDTEGKVVKTSDKIVTQEDIEENLKFFRGEIEQLPPIYSAIKVNGKKLYEYARAGQEVKIEPRKVTIFELELVNFNQAAQKAEIKIVCSKGTYIRSIANDLGEKLRAFGHLIKLVRIKAGDFYVEDSIKLEDLNSPEIVLNKLIYPTEKLNFAAYNLNEEEKRKISNGNAITPNQPFEIDEFVTLMDNEKLAAIAKFDGKFLKCEKVFL